MTVSLQDATQFDRTPSRGRATLRLVGQVARANPLPLAVLLFFVVIASARVGVYVAAEGAFVDALLDADGRQALTWALIWIGTNAVEEFYWVIKPWLFAIVRDHATHRIQKQVLERAAAVPLVAYEQGPFFARLQRASDDIGTKLSDLLLSLIDTLQVFVMGASIAVTLWFVSPWLTPILLLAAIPSILIETRVASAVQQALLKHATGSQFLDRISWIIRDRDSAAELRLFGNGPDLLSRWRQTRAARADDVLAAEWRRSRAGLGSETLRSLAFAACVAIALWSITGQHLTIGSWVIVTTGIGWMSAMIRYFAEVSRMAREQVAYAGDLFAFEEQADALIAAELRNRQAATPVTQPDSPPGIELRDVTFTYPGQTAPALTDVSFTIAPGETIAIVGGNGAGKSTLVRLIIGLYLPDGGSVRVGEVDTREEGAPDRLPQIGAVFQDYLSFQLPARDNIALGDPNRPPDDAEILVAAQQAGVLGLVESLPDGLDTWLGREFGDRDLSGGQWQRFALARAFYRDANLLILDEPTAALDPQAEQTLFDQYVALVADRTAIMISHRLASARLADRILVMDQGQLVEQGPHDELMARGGLYATMFTAQAEWYRDTATA